ncbi:MAG TPA: hypothetical protein VGM62_15860 [Chthoniobacterales bacterium]|jgi:hypothetical protein
MKFSIFTLTKPEQRVVIMIVMVLLIAAFIRYWRNVNEQKALNRDHPANSVATPFASPSNVPLDADDEMDPAMSRPSSQSPP